MKIQTISTYFLLFLIFLVIIFFSACFRVQQKPKALPNNSPGETHTDQKNGSFPEYSTSATDNENFEPANNTGNNDTPELELQKLENKFILTDAFPGLSFERPLELQNAGNGSGQIYIVEQSGKIYFFNTGQASDPSLFLDLSDKVDDSSNEKGLLGLAFHPGFKENGKFFVNYTARSSTIISQFTIDKNNQDKSDPGSEKIILSFNQPYPNHNGGKLAFGPDGYLYIATGDGGSGGDPQKNAQNLRSLLGKILRIDVDKNETGLTYSIPKDNPFKDNAEGFREEIYAYGLRNPWRFSFDTLTGELWAADVGQDKIEEIDIIQNGKNYGWNIMEGSYCYEPPTGCDPSGLELPVYEYEHPIGESITGGYVYRGKELPVLQGVYIYADFITGYIWGLVDSGAQGYRNFTLAETGLNISSFGTDESQELYILAFDGKIYKLALP